MKIIPVKPIAIPAVNLKPIEDAIATTQTEIAKVKSDGALVASVVETQGQNINALGAPIAGLNQTTRNLNQALQELRQQVSETSTNLVPSPAWITPVAGNNSSLWYRRESTVEITSIELEFCHPSDLLTIGKQTLTDFTTGFSPSGFWGGSAKFTQHPLANGKTITTVIAISQRQVTLFVADTANESPAMMRNIKINGVAQDFQPLPDRLKSIEEQKEALERQVTTVPNVGSLPTAPFNLQVLGVAETGLRYEYRTGAFVAGIPARIDRNNGVWTPIGLVPDSSWLRSQDYATRYERTLKGVTINRLQFEICQRDDKNKTAALDITDFVTGCTISGYWGIMGRFFDQVVVDRTLRLFVGVDVATGRVVIMVMDNGISNPKYCWIRNVKLNGIPADLISSNELINGNATAIATNATAITTNTALVNRLTKQTVTVANAGVAVAVGDRIQCRIATTGNQSLQFSAVSGTVTWEGWSSHSIENGLTPATIASHSMSTTWEYAMAGLTFTRQCDTQTVILRDTTNGRNWKVTVAIGNSFNNSQFVVEEFS